MLMFSVLFTVLIALFVLHVIKLAKDKPKNFPPGLPRLPFYGSYWCLLWGNYRHLDKALDYFGKKYKTRVLGFYLGNCPAIATFDYELCKEVLTRDEFTERAEGIIFETRGFGEKPGVAFGTNWKEQRWLALRNMRDFGFGRRSLKVEEYSEGEVKNLIELLISEPNAETKDVCSRKGVVCMPEVLQGHLMNLILLILTATRYDYAKLRELARSNVKFLRSIDPTGNAISMTPWLRFLAPEFFGFTSAIRDNKPMLDFLKQEVEEHKKTFISGYPRDYIDIYLEELEKNKGKNIPDTSISEKELLFTLLDFMFPVPLVAGHTLNYIFAHLIYHPEVQKKIQEEIDNVVGRSRLPNLDDRKNMPYTEAAIREGIRINPVAPVGVSRRAAVDTTLAGYFIPKNTLVYPCISAVHSDPELWGDPQNFRPERWIEEDGTLKKKDHTLGFGAGKRLCPGETFTRQTMFLIVAGLLQHFTFRTPEGAKKPDLDNLIWGIITTVPNYSMEAVVRV